MILIALAGTLWVAFVTVLWLCFRSKKNEMQVKAETPPFAGIPIAPGGHWLFGHLLLIGKHGFIEGQRRLHVASADEDGLCSIYFLNTAALSMLKAKDVKAVLNASSYRESIWLHKSHGDHFLGPKALVTLMGKDWRYYRNIVHRSFTPAALRGSQRAINTVARTLSRSLLRSVANAPGGKYLAAILPIMKMATIDVFGLAALGEDFGCCAGMKPAPVGAAFDFLADEYTRRLQSSHDPSSFLYWLPTARNRRHAAERNLIRTYIAGLCADKRKEMESGDGGGKTDLLTSLLRASAEKGGDEMSDAALTDCLMTLLFGGYDTTSITLAYALYLLATNEDVQSECVQEAREVLGNDNGHCTLEDPAAELPYTRAVVLETLRLYPAAPVTTRNLEKTLELRGKVFEKGAMMYVPIWSIQRDERNFPDPDRIRPDRWVERKDDGRWRERSDFKSCSSASPSMVDNGAIAPANRDAFCAFSAGARNCVGRNLAMREAVTLLAFLVRDLRFDCLDRVYEVEPTLSSFVQKPKDDMPMIVSARGR